MAPCHSSPQVEDKLEGENTTLRFVDSWTVFRADAGLAHLALHLRQKWSALFLRRLQAPGKPMTPLDLAVLDAVVAVLTAEEAELGLTQPHGIGQRPKMILGSDNICRSPGEGSGGEGHPRGGTVGRPDGGTGMGFNAVVIEFG